jgi:hypothetical protein
LIVFVGFFAVNIAAYRQAAAVTHLAAEGTQTAPLSTMEQGDVWRVLWQGAVITRPRNEKDPSSIGVHFETDRFGDYDGLQIEAWRVVLPGVSKGTVVMFPDYGAAKSSMLAEAKVFLGLGYEVYLVDHRGMGGSEGDFTSGGWYEAKEVVAAYKRIKERATGKVLLYGQSMGAVAILRAIHVDALEPDGVILEAPYESLLSGVGHRLDAIEVPGMPTNLLLVFWLGARLDFPGFDLDAGEYAASVSCPALVLLGGKDTRSSGADARAIQKQLSGHSSLFVFPAASAGSYLSADSESWKKVVGEFLDGPGKAPSGAEPVSEP